MFTQLQAVCLMLIVGLESLTPAAKQVSLSASVFTGSGLLLLGLAVDNAVQVAAVGLDGYYKKDAWGCIFTGSLLVEAVGTLALGHDIRWVWLRSFRVLLVSASVRADAACSSCVRVCRTSVLPWSSRRLCRRCVQVLCKMEQFRPTMVAMLVTFFDKQVVTVLAIYSVVVSFYAVLGQVRGVSLGVRHAVHHACCRCPPKGLAMCPPLVGIPEACAHLRPGTKSTVSAPIVTPTVTTTSTTTTTPTSLVKILFGEDYKHLDTEYTDAFVFPVGKGYVGSGIDSEAPRFARTFASLFCLTTTENYPGIAYPALLRGSAYGHAYFVSYIILTIYLIKNVLLGATYSSWKTHHKRQLLTLRVQRYHNLLIAWQVRSTRRAAE